MLEREFPKTDRLRAARSSSVSIASRTSAAPVERRLVTQSDGTDQSDGTSLIVALMQSSASCAHPCSWLMLENASRSYRCTHVRHMLAQPLAFSLIVHHDCSSRSQAFIHARAGEHFAFIAAPHSIENVLRVLRSSMLPLCSLARERLALIVAHSCNSLALIVALACNSPVHTHRALIVPHRRSSYQASCVHPRSSWRTSCVRRCSSMLMLENAFRVCYAQVRSLYAPLLENACAHRRSCLQQP